MNQLIRTLAIAISLLTTTANINAIPARGNWHTYANPDGSTIELSAQGDEFFHYYIDHSGNRFIASGDGGFTAINAGETASRAKRAAAQRSAARVGSRTTFPSTGSPHVPVILVQFSDKSFSFPADNFKNMMNQPGYSEYKSTGSAADYFADNSCGKFTPQFDVYGPVTLSGKVADYGTNDDYGNDAEAYRMVIEACTMLDDEIDFSNYDNDGDGVADIVYIYYAGYGENDGGSATTVWPHSSTLAYHSATLTLDGIAINPYSCSNELLNGYGKYLTGIGTFCHEFTHVLGFPDLYATDGSDIATPLYWTLMDRGSYNNDGHTPAAYTAYERSFMGWMTPTEAEGDAAVALPSISENRAYRVSTANPDEYFLIEYRPKVGWDASIPGAGVLVWHIDYNKSAWDGNSVNNNANRQRVCLVSADGRTDDYDRAAVAFQGAATLTATSSPGFAVYGSDKVNTTINITSVGGDYATFTINGGGKELSAPTVQVSDIRDKGFTVKWNAVDGATGYLITICDIDGRPVGNWCNYATDATSVTVSDLSPVSAYSVSLAAVAGASLSRESAAVEVTTDVPGLSFTQPDAPTISEVTPSSFLVSWNEISGAESYIIDIWSLGEGDAQGDIANFDNGLTLPDGWATTCGSTFRVNGYYGEAAPSIVFANNAEYIETPKFSATPLKFSMWLRGRNIADNSSLEISGLKDGKWEKIDNVVASTTAATYQLDGAKLAGYTALRITRTDAVGTIMVDDVTVAYGNATVEDYVVHNLNIGNATTYRATGLTDNTEYYVSLRGANTLDESLPSAVAHATTGNSGFVADMAVDSYEISGRVITLHCDGNIADLAGRTIASGRGEHTLLPGIYILSTSEKTTKILIK